MLTMLTAYTLEADDAAFALNDILRQLEPEKNLKAHSAGMLFCHPDFMESGVAQSIADQLPFDVIGTTLLANMVSGLDDPLMLSISVFTSDDVEFTSLFADGLEQREALTRGYVEAARGRDGAPGLIFTLVPMKIYVGVETLLMHLDELTGGAPIFGAVSVDHTTDLSRCYTLRNGEMSKTGMAALLLWGDVNPSFYTTTMSEKYVQKQRAIITKSHENLLEEVNDMPFIQYLENIGVSGNGAQELAGVPFIVNYNDGTRPVARGIHTVTEEGFAFCSGLMPLNGTLAIGTVEESDVLRMTEEAMKAALASGKREGCIMFPCVSHFLTMGINAQQQKEIALELMPGELPFMWGYSAGEICPVYDEAGKLHNRFHSFTMVICVF